MSRTAPVAFALVLLLAGCGTTSLSTQELRSQATRLCTAAHRQTDRIAAPSSPAGAAAYIAQGLAVLEPELRGLRALHAPHDLAQVYSTSINDFGQQLDALRVASHALSSGGDPVVAIKTLEQRLGPLAEDADSAWRALGIPACVTR